MIKKKLDSRIIRYEFNSNKLKNEKEIDNILERMYPHIKIGTYGGMNTDILFEYFRDKGYKVKREEICPTADDDMGLRMPDFWPINQGKNALNIAMYYNWMQIKETAKKEDLSFWNPKIRKDYGWIGIIEIQKLDMLVRRLDQERKSYFSTPRTLTECARFLEGHNSKRLLPYKDFSEKIRKWAKKQDFYNERERGLGKKKSLELQKSLGRPSNVKKCVRKFWEEELLNKRYSLWDRELNIVSKDFANNRNPDIVLVGEDIFGTERRKDSSDFVSWLSPSKNEGEYLSIRKFPEKNKQYLTGKALAQKYPRADIILLSYSPKIKKPFMLVAKKGEKEKTNLESVLAHISCLDILGERFYKNKLIDQLE